MGGVNDFLTDAELAEELGKGRGFVQARCRGDKPEWPHLRVGKSIRFTPEHVAWITAHLTVGPKITPANPWGHKGRSA